MDLMFLLWHSQGTNISSLFKAIENKWLGLSDKIQHLMSRVFTRMWPTSDKGEDILQHFLTWPAYPRYLNLIRKYVTQKQGQNE